MIDPHRPSASTIYLSRVIDPHHPTASTIYFAPDPSTPSNCIYYHFAWHLVNLHRPSVSTVLSRTWIDQSTPSNCNLTLFASCFIQTVDEIRVSGIPPHFATQFRHPFLRAQDPHGKKRAKQQPPQLFSSQLLAQNLIRFHPGFSVFGQRKKQTKNPIM